MSDADRLVKIGMQTFFIAAGKAGKMNVENRKKIVGYSVLVLVICVTGWLYLSGKDGMHSVQWTQGRLEETLSADTKATEQVSGTLTEEQAVQTVSDSVPQTCWVYVCGAVYAPGVYELPIDGRIYMAVEAAGGLLEEADASAVNLAATLTDGSQIYIPVIGEERSSDVRGFSGTDASEESADGKINLNTATKAQLMELPGIGEARAEAILQYRETVGKFSSIEEIMQVSGIKNALFEQIKLQITV